MSPVGPAASILIVDDELRNRRLLEVLLQPQGYLTRSVASGEEALAAIAEQAPDLVLLDVMMSGMDGNQVAAVLKGDPATASIPIIMVTAQADRAARLAGLAAGVEEYLAKPVDRAELYLRVRNLLRLKTLGDFFRTHRDSLEREVRERTRDLDDAVLASLNMMEDAVRQREKAEEAYARFEETHAQLVEASRRDGMAEVATSILHNVGNVLNSVNVSASLVAEHVKNSRASSLASVAGMLREHEADLAAYLTNDEKGRHIPAFLAQLAQQWLAQQQSVVKELELLRANIDHIKEIVAVQQGHAKFAGAPESVDLRDLVEDSLRMNAGSLVRHEIQVVREFAQVPTVSVAKHKVLQILVNLVRNAKQACSELEGAGKCMTLRIAEVNGRVRISVSDNGAGIAPENLTRIFSHGFTTRKDGHGFGLHSGALAAVELGGSLSAHSEGAGKGATFTLELAPQPAAVPA